MNKHGCQSVNDKKFSTLKGTYGGGRMVKSLSDICLGCIASNLDSIANVGQNLPSIHKELLLRWLADHEMLTTSYLPHVTYNLFSSSLKHVKFYRCKQLTDDILASLAKTGCKLKKLTIKNCPNVTDVGIQSITRGQDELTSFNIKELPAVVDKALCYLKSPNLAAFKVKECNISTAGMKVALSNNPSIKIVKINFCVKLEESLFPVMATTLRDNLEELHCRDVRCMTDSSLLAIAEHCRNLRILDLLGSSKITKQSMEKVFQNCTKLKRLDISYCTKLQEQPDARVLFEIPSTLQDLSLCGVFINDKELLVSALQRLKKLQKIRLCGVPCLNDDALHEILQAIGKDLQLLDLSGCRDITDHGLRAVNIFCKSLEEIHLTQVKNITGEPLKLLLKDKKRADQLTRLNLSSTQFSEDVLYTVVTHCHNLEMLHIAGHLYVTDDILLCIAENCPKLREMFLKGCKMVTDVGVCEIARHCPLKVLSVSGLHGLTDKTIFALAGSCHYLEEIYLNGCSLISRTALRYLVDCCIPRVHYMHRVPNASPDMLMAKNLDTGEFCRVDRMN